MIISAVDLVWNKKLVKGEMARKISHILTGLVVAFSPYFLTWREMQIAWIIALLFLAVVRATGLIKSLYDVDRRSLGDVVGPFTLGVLTLFEPDPLIFTVATLYLTLSDGLAAIVGTRYGKGNSYKVVGATKSIAGTAAFLVVSVLIALGVLLCTDTFQPSIGLLVVVLPVANTVVENVAGYGLDNVAVPVFVFSYLHLLQ